MDLETASREELIELIVEQSELIAKLVERIAILQEQNELLERKPPDEGQDGATSTPKWVKPNRPQREKKPRKPRTRGYARKRSTPTRRVLHAIDACRQCGCTLKGGSVKRTREVLHIPLAPLEVIEHAFIERRCPLCNERQTPGAEVLQGEVLGQHRVSVQTMAMIATLREEGRLPIATIQWMLQAFHGLELAQGEIVAILHAVAERGWASVAAMPEQLRASPVVHGDETSWRENGRNGYFWHFSTPEICYMIYRYSRSGQIVEEVMGQSPNTTMVTDFYAAYNRHRGPHQRCWAHLLRDIHELKERYPDDEAVQVWAKAVHALYLEACACRERLRNGKWLAR